MTQAWDFLECNHLYGFWWHDRSIDELELSARAYHCLRYLEVATIGQLVTLSPRKILHTPNVGKRTLREIQEVMADHNLRLPGE